MSDFDPYKGHRPVGETVSPEAVNPRRALDELDSRADEILAERTALERAAEIAAIWGGVERETTVARIETDTRVVPVRGGERWSLRRKLALWGGVALMATGAIWAGANHFTMSDEEFAQELLRRGEDPAAYCASKGGVLDVVSTSGTNEDGDGYIEDDDLLWRLWGNQGQLVADANRVELGAGGELGICNPSDPDDGQRDELLIVPTRTNMGELRIFLARRQ